MKVFSLAAAIALAGCASPPRVLTAQEAATMPVLDLCVGTLVFGPVSSQVARAEVARRGEDCSQHKEEVAAKIRADAAIRAAVINSFSAPVTCHTVTTGNTAQTNCF